MFVCLFVCRTKRKFGGEYFRFVVTLVFIQCVVNATFARVGKLYHLSADRVPLFLALMSGFQTKSVIILEV